MNGNEYPETNLYTVDNLFYAEECSGGYSVYSIYQREKNITYRSGDYRFECANHFQICDDMTYLRGRRDFDDDIVSWWVSKEGFNKFKQACERLPEVMAIVYNRGDIAKYRQQPFEEPPKLYNIIIDGTPTNEEINEMISKVNLDNFIKMIQARIIRDYKEGDLSDLPDFKLLNKRWAKKYLKDWAISKYRFYKLFNNNLTIENEVDTDPADDDIADKLEDLKNKFPLYEPIISKFSGNAIKKNLITKTTCGSDSLRDIIDKEGMTFTKFMALYNNKDLDMEISKIYQDKGKTKIVASIDPLDFLTVSINTAGWKSCHNFYDGCYRNACLSYMFDETSLVGYATKGTTNIRCYDRKLELVNKRWREMIYVSKINSTVVFSREYPHNSIVYSKALRAMIENQISKELNVNDTWLLTTNSNKYADVEQDAPLYNDVGNGWKFNIIINKYDMNKEKHIIDIGKTAKKVIVDGYITNSEEEIC